MLYEVITGQSVREFEANYGLNLRQQSFQEAQAQIDNAIKRGQLSVSQGNLALQQAKFYADNDPNSIDNQIKQQQLIGMQQANQPQAQQFVITSYSIHYTKLYDFILLGRYKT